MTLPPDARTTDGPRFTAGQLVHWRPDGRKRDPVPAKVLNVSKTGRRIRIEYEYESYSGKRKWWAYVMPKNLEPRDV